MTVPDPPPSWPIGHQHMSAPSPAVSVLVVSWDGYERVWEPFFRCFFRHWPDCPFPVNLGANSRSYPDPRVRPVLFGEEADYSSNLIRMLEQVRADWVILWVDDFLLAENVDTARILKIVALAEREGAGYVNLTALPHEITPLFTVTDVEGEIGEIDDGAPYSFALGVTLWRREVILAALRPGESPWQIERDGSLRIGSLPYRFFFVARRSVTRPPVRVINAIQEGRWTRLATRMLLREGLGAQLAGRDVESAPSTLVLAAYKRLRYHGIRLVCRIGGRRAMKLVSRIISRRLLVMRNY